MRGAAQWWWACRLSWLYAVQARLPVRPQPRSLQLHTVAGWLIPTLLPTRSQPFPAPTSSSAMQSASREQLEQ